MRNTGKINKSKIESNFTTIRNDLIRDKNLSMQEKSLLFFILSHPPNWSINRQYLYNSFSDSKSGIDKAFIGLTDKGFIKSTKLINDKGRFTGWSHEVTDIPTSTIPKVGKPTIGEPEVGITESRNPDRRKTSPIEKKEGTNKEFINNDWKQRESVKNNPPPALVECQNIFSDLEHPQYAESFYNYYESNGWRKGSNPIVNITAAAKTWIEKENKLYNQNKTTQNGLNKPSASTNIEQYQRHFDDCIEYIKELGI